LTAALIAAFVVSLVVLALVLDDMWRTTKRLRRQIRVADLRTQDHLEGFCWTYLRDEAYRAAIAITLARHGAVTVEDLVPLLDRARELNAHSVRVPSRLEVVR
jgi:cytochrome c biogenesis protein ResB